MEVVRHAFRPEFLNRLDDIILFNRLDKSVMADIVDVQLQRLHALLNERGIAMTLDDSARALLAEEGYDPVYGARPLKRVIQREIQNKLAEMVLKDALHAGQTVAVTAKKDVLAFCVV
jgi:ATP-dependent Clp protease ATP-binding subunit ClpB